MPQPSKRIHSTPKSKGTPTVRIAGESIAVQLLVAPAQAAHLQAQLRAAKQKYGHALCECVSPNLKLQIKLRDGSAHLAVWPHEGHLHDSNCYFFRHEAEYHPATQIEGSFHRNALGIKDLHLSFELERDVTAKDGVTQEQEQRSPANLRELSHLLWGDAKLNRWHPQWSRDWGKVRTELLDACSKVHVKAVPLASHVFVPRPYRPSIKDMITREQGAFLNGLQKKGNIIPSGILVAPVNRLEEIGDGTVLLHLKHMRKPVGVSKYVATFLKQNCRNAMNRLAANADESKNQTRDANWTVPAAPQALAFLQIEVSASGGVWARAAWILSVHPRLYVPTQSADEVLLVDALSAGEYEFERTMSTRTPMQRSEPDWIVRHVVDPRGVAVPKASLEIWNNGGTPELLGKRQKIAALAASLGMPTWVWSPRGRQVDHVVPALPPKQSTVKRDTSARLRSMEQAAFLHYGYGHKVWESPSEGISGTQPKG